MQGAFKEPAMKGQNNIPEIKVEYHRWGQY